MSASKGDLNNKALSDVEKFLLLLSDLKIVESEIKDQIDVSDIKPDIKSANIEPLDIEPLDIKRSPSAYSFPSLLDDLPFLRDIQPFQSSKFDENSNETQRQAEVDSAEASQYLSLAKTEKKEQVEEIKTINLIQSLLLSSDILSSEKSQFSSQPQLKEQSQEQPKDILIKNLLDKSLEDDQALHLLQDILVVPELEELRSFKIAVEQKLGIVESQVNSPDLMNKIKELENLVQHASIDLNKFGSKLIDVSNEQNSIPMEIANLRNQLGQLEQQIYEPNALVKLLLPIVAELLNRKVAESREAMCQAIMPIIAEVIFERSQLDRVVMSHAIADLLPDAISEQIRNSPDEIANALAPEMGKAIKQQIMLESDSMVEALYPVIGNTIAKYLAEAIRSINEKVEQTFSAEGLQRKFRAKMRGVSEAELILKESLPFEVQAVFLIHNLSGLVMIDIQQSDLDLQADPIDSDMLAGMLTAIRSFASECMSRSASNNELDAITYSGSKILLEVAGYCYLAVIIRGEPDRALVTKIRNVFGQIVQVYGDRLKQFDGDPSIIPIAVESELKTLMEIAHLKPSKKSSKTLIFIGLALFTLIFVPIGIYQYQSQRDRQLEAKVLEALASTPELSVYRLSVVANGDRLNLSGKLPSQYLRDRSVQVVSESARASNIDNIKIDNNIYAVNIPADPTLVALEVQRLTKVLNYTAGVKIASQFKDGQVTITGKIEQPSMISKITQAYTKISGISTVTNATTILSPKIPTRIYFPFAVTTLQTTEMDKLLEVQAFLTMYPDYKINIFTKSDNIGDRTVNYELGIKRCQVVRDYLLQRGVTANRLHISGIIDTPIMQTADQMARWVEFEPTLK